MPQFRVTQIEEKNDKNGHPGKKTTLTLADGSQVSTWIGSLDFKKSPVPAYPAVILNAIIEGNVARKGDYWNLDKEWKVVGGIPAVAPAITPQVPVPAPASGPAPQVAPPVVPEKIPEIPVYDLTPMTQQDLKRYRDELLAIKWVLDESTIARKQAFWKTIDLIKLVDSEIMEIMHLETIAVQEKIVSAVQVLAMHIERSEVVLEETPPAESPPAEELPAKKIKGGNVP